MTTIVTFVSKVPVGRQIVNTAHGACRQGPCWEWPLNGLTAIVMATGTFGPWHGVGGGRYLGNPGPA